MGEEEAGVEVRGMPRLKRLRVSELYETVLDVGEVQVELLGPRPCSPLSHSSRVRAAPLPDLRGMTHS